jgi:hypothetical protein
MKSREITFSLDFVVKSTFSLIKISPKGIQVSSPELTPRQVADSAATSLLQQERSKIKVRKAWWMGKAMKIMGCFLGFRCLHQQVFCGRHDLSFQWQSKVFFEGGFASKFGIFGIFECLC